MKSNLTIVIYIINQQIGHSLRCGSKYNKLILQDQNRKETRAHDGRISRNNEN